MRRIVKIACLAALLAGCGGGGSHGNGITLGPFYWALPWVPMSASQKMSVGFHNLDRNDTSVTLQAFEPDGTAYTAPVVYPLDGDDQEIVYTSALFGGPPVGGFVLAWTPSRKVEVFARYQDLATEEEEAAPGYGLPDLAAPIAWKTGLTVTAAVEWMQIGNPNAAPIVVSYTAYEEPLDPASPPVEGTSGTIPLAAFESTIVAPSTLGGDFATSFRFTAAAPFFASTWEDPAVHVPQVRIEARILSVDLRHGREIGVTFDSLRDFALVARNDEDAPRSITIQDIRRPDGTAILSTPRTLNLAPFESIVATSQDAPFVDLFADPSLASGLQQFHMTVSQAGGVDLSFREYDPLSLSPMMVVRPSEIGHVHDAMKIHPVLLGASDLRTTTTILNPNQVAIDVQILSVVTQPEGFDGAVAPLLTTTVPANGSVNFSPDGLTFFDRDLVEARTLVLRFVSNSGFAVGGRREKSTSGGLLYMISPVLVRAFDGDTGFDD